MHKRKNSIVRLLIFVLFATLGISISSTENIIYIDPNGTTVELIWVPTAAQPRPANRI